MDKGSWQLCSCVFNRLLLFGFFGTMSSYVLQAYIGVFNFIICMLHASSRACWWRIFR